MRGRTYLPYFTWGRREGDYLNIIKRDCDSKQVGQHCFIGTVRRLCIIVIIIAVCLEFELLSLFNLISFLDTQQGTIKWGNIGGFL